MARFSICLNFQRKTCNSPLKPGSGPLNPGHWKNIDHRTGVAKMIQFFRKYGFFVTMANRNDLAIHC